MVDGPLRSLGLTSLVWRFLWSGGGMPRSRLIIWRIIQHGYYINLWGAKWDATANVCPAYAAPGENTTHVLWLREYTTQMGDD